MILPSTRSLQAFVATAQFGSLAAASTRIAMSVPTLSRRLAELEKQLDVRLLDRGARGTVLTEAGTRYLPHAVAILERLRLAAAELRRDEGVVRVTTIPAFATRWLLPRLPAFTAKYPGIEVDVRTSFAFERLDSGAYDLAIRLALDSEMAGMPPLMAIHLTPVWGSASTPMIERPTDLLGRTLLGPEHRPEFWGEWLRWAGLDAAHVQIRDVDSLLLYERTLHEPSISIGIEPLVSDLLASGRLHSFFGGRVRSARSFFLVAPDNPPKRAVRVFSSWLKQAARGG